MLPRLALLLTLACALGGGDAWAAGTSMFDVGTNTGQKPQSKIWHNDGSWWAVLDGPNGVSIYEKNGSNWDEGSFVDANITNSGAADVIWNGSNLFVLVYTGSPKLYKYTYDSGLRSYDLMSGFPVNVPNPSGSETMAFDQDSTGRLWATAEGGGDINVYYTTSANHQNWSSEIVLQSGVNADDISSVIAFGGNKIGVLWSDQSAEEYGFSYRNDSDSPTTWQSNETVSSGGGVADDHLNLATDSTGRIWCATKNADDELQVHRRSSGGSWTTQEDATGGSGTRPIIMVNEDDNLLYLIYVNWDVSPRSVYYQTASLNSLNFGNETDFLSDNSAAMNNPTGLKQVLPGGTLMCIATLDESEAWWNGFGDPPGGGGGGPTPPTNLVATLQTGPDEVDLTWDEPSSGAPDGYNVYRQVDGGSFVQINGSLVTSTSFTDPSPPAAFLCYEITAETGGNETSSSNTECVDNAPPAPPTNLVATLNQNPNEVDLSWDVPVTGSPDGYNIYRQVDGGAFVQINGSLETSTSFTDDSPPQGNLCYEVTAENSSVETAASNTDCVDNTPLPPTNLAATLNNTPNEVDLTWDEPASGAPDGYNVYRQVDGGSFVQINGSLVTGTSFTDNGPPEQPLCYEVTAVTSGAETASSNTECVDNTPVPPANLVATLNNNPDSVDLSWDEPTSGTPDGYNVYRQVDGGSFVQINGSLLTSTSFTDSTPPEDPLCYEVTAVTGGNETASSNTECVDNTPPAPATNLTASLQQMPDEVTLNWDEPTTGEPDGYNVYRQVAGGAFTQINGSLVTDTTYQDNSPPQDSLCYYVTAETSGEETAPSNSDCVDNSPPMPPDAPENLTLTQVDPGSLSRVLGLAFDEGSGQLVNDFSGAGNHGFLGAGPAADAADPSFGSSGGRDYLTFDGAGTYLQLPDAASFDFPGSFTVETWIRPNSNVDGTIIEKGAGLNRTFSLRTTSGGALDFSWDEGGAAKSTSTGSVLSTNTWHHIACVYDAGAGENRIYLDGALVQSSSVSGTPEANEYPVCIGATADTTTFFDGDIDQIHVFSDAVYGADFVPPLAVQMPAGASGLKGGHSLAALAPSVPQIANGGAGVLIEWDAAGSGEPSVSYNVYRIIDSNSELLNPTPLSTTTFLDADSTLGPRCYEITAFSNLGLESVASSQECTSVSAPSSLADAPTITSAEDFEGPDQVTLNWQAPAQGPSPTGYHVYRSVNGSFPQRITGSPVAGLTYDDTNLAAGDLCYSVRSIVADGREGLASADSCVSFVPAPPTEPQFVIAMQDSVPIGPASGVAAYRMNEGSGQTLEDATGNGHTGQLGDDPGPDSSDPLWTTGISGGALQFDGANDFVIVPDAPDLQIAGSFTVEAWFKLTGTADHAILSKGGSQERNYWIIIESGGIIDFRWETPGGANHGTASGEVVTDSNWHHVACIYDIQAGENRIYLDGVLVQQDPDSGTPVTSNDPLYIGGRISTSSVKDEFEGCIDLVRVSAGAVYTTNFTPPTDYNAGGNEGPKINLSWAPPTNGYTTHYKVYRAIDGGSWTVIDSTVTDTLFVDATLDSVGPLVCYMISGVDGAGSEGILSPPVCVGSQEPTSVWEEPKDLAALPVPGLRVGPNPFNPTVRIQFDVARSGMMTLQIYDVRGRLVDTLWNGVVPVGEQSHVWRGRTSSGRSVASGSYFVVMRMADRTERRKITLVR